MVALSAVRILRIKGESQGLDELKGKLQGVATAEGQVAVASEKSSAASEGYARRLRSLQLTLDATYRQEQLMQRAARDLEGARMQGLISMEREAQLLALAEAKYSGAGKAAARYAEGIARAKEVALGLAGVFSAGFLSVGLAELPRAISEAVDQLGNLGNKAETIGITTTALQQLRYAARLSDVDVGSLDDALEKFSINAGKAGSPLRKIFDANNKAITGDVLRDVETFADLVQNASNAEERNALVTTAFGKSAAEMGRLFADGGAGIAAWADEAQRAGAVINDSVIQRARELGDEMEALRPLIEAAWSEFAVLVAPAIIGGLGALNAALRTMSDLAGNISSKLGPLLLMGIGIPGTGLGAGLSLNIMGSRFAGAGANSSGSPDDRDQASVASITVHGGHTIIPEHPVSQAAHREVQKFRDELTDAQKAANALAGSIESSLGSALASIFSGPVTSLQDALDGVLKSFAGLGQQNLQSLFTGKFAANDNSSSWTDATARVFGTAIEKGAKAGSHDGLQSWFEKIPGGAGSVSAALGGLGVGYQTQSPLLGGLGGALSGAAVGGIIGAVVGGVSGLIGNPFKGRSA